MAQWSPSGDEPREKVRIPVKRSTRAGSDDEAKASGRRDEEAEEEAEAIETETTETEAATWRDRYLRMAADLENTKKRLERIHTDRTLTAQERLLRDLLPLADNLERALAHASPAEQRSSLYTGVELTLKEFLGTLEKHGVRRIEALGEPFDPELHEAIGASPHPTLSPGTVMHVELPGYTFKGRLLRPARVLVVAEG
ncbi:MAG: nucleotide exchange factor GrpE [Candidatus Promineifilaceae bacterium]|nr:nucleotide exchange factor GrpE [Candidatus Promineifilaceae bacterium]